METTTKVRIVFDCSAKTDGVSLNDAICAGPKLQKDLLDVLIRFRRNLIALACDIKEMYLQVGIEERDPYFRLLWRDLDSSRETDVYEFSRVAFGKNSAPMEVQFVAQENARRHQDVYPLAAETVLKSTYMDDSIDSVETVQDGIQLYKELDSLWGIAGMQARKWVSNSPEVVAATPEADRATELSFTVGQEHIYRTSSYKAKCTEEGCNCSVLWVLLSSRLRSCFRNCGQGVMTGMMLLMMKLQVDSEVGVGSLGAWIMCRCLDVCVKQRK